MITKSPLSGCKEKIIMGGIMFSLASQAALADISGKVFRDFNANGTFDSGSDITEVGMPGITVKAFDSIGAEKASAISGADGSYALTGLTSGGSYRLEFSWAETWLKPGAAGGTTIQFAKDGNTNVDLAVNNPLDYSQVDMDVVTPVAIVGPADQEVAAGHDHRTLAALVKFPFNATGKPADPGYIPPTTLATHGQIGSTSGSAFRRETGQVFVAAYYKRATGFGPGGPGAVYRVDADGTVSLHATIPNAGSDIHDFSGSYSTVNYDTAAVPAVGKSSLGDMEISADGQSLYVVNLHDRHLYGVATDTANTVTDLGAITRPASCPDGDFRPFALGMDGTNTLYIGAVCSNESGTSAYPSAFVLKYDGTAGFTEVFNTGLSFNNQSFWKNWTDILNAGYPAMTASLFQPLLSDLVFDGKDMVLAFRNRNWEVGYVPGGSSPAQSHVLKACWAGSGWTLENNGACGGITGTLPNYSVTAEAGPGGGYFFDMRDSLASFGGQPVINALGSVAIAPGRSIVATLSDPQDLISGGVKHLNPATGGGSLNYQVFRGSADGSNGGGTGGYFGKTGGMGDMELMLDPAPIEIGNRVWLDTNGNGIQDADEAGIPNVQVQLKSGATVVATATTAADGTYYFSNATGTSTANAIYGISQLQPNTAYTIHFPTTVTVSGTSYNLTAATAGGNTLIDSNTNASGDVVVAATDIPAAGTNNHSFDVGYTATATPPTGCVTVTNTVQVSKVNETDSNAANNTASVSMQVNCSTPQTDLKLTKTASKTTVRAGDTVTYTLTLTNESSVNATNVKVTDNLPAGVTYSSHNTLQGTYDAGTGIWDVGTVAAGKTVTLTVDVAVN
jgi:uncharacterized repeat protein (TIGR01451 family)